MRSGARPFSRMTPSLDDQDFHVAYEVDDLREFAQLVRELRGTNGRRFTVRDTPVLVGVHRDPRELLAELSA